MLLCKSDRRYCQRQYRNRQSKVLAQTHMFCSLFATGITIAGMACVSLLTFSQNFISQTGRDTAVAHFGVECFPGSEPEATVDVETAPIDVVVLEDELHRTGNLRGIAYTSNWNARRHFLACGRLHRHDHIGTNETRCN